MLYTEETIFPPSGRYSKAADNIHMAVKANGGTVTIKAILSDDSEVDIENGIISEDDAFSLKVSGGRFKVTPSGGATFEWQA